MYLKYQKEKNALCWEALYMMLLDYYSYWSEHIRSILLLELELGCLYYSYKAVVPYL